MNKELEKFSEITRSQQTFLKRLNHVQIRYTLRDSMAFIFGGSRPFNELCLVKTIEKGLNQKKNIETFFLDIEIFQKSDTYNNTQVPIHIE